MTSPVTDIPIIILAAGQSTRMRGSDKLLQTIDSQPLLRRQADMARDVTSGPVIVTLPPSPHPRYAALSEIDVRIVPVSDADEGMNASLRAGIKAVPEGSGAVLVLLGDLPDLTHDDLSTVIRSWDEDDGYLIWRGATEDGKPGHPVIFSSQLFNDIARLKGDSGGREVVQASKGRVKLVPLAGQRARLDLDTPEDWAKWRASRPAAD